MLGLPSQAMVKARFFIRAFATKIPPIIGPGQCQWDEILFIFTKMNDYLFSLLLPLM
jgi:hypothetical protein